jgi:glucokinase
MSQAVIGVDIGGTNTRIALTIRDGHCFSEHVLRTNKHEDVHDFIDEMIEAMREIKRNHSDYDIVGIGIGAPNGNFYKGTIEHAPNLNWKGIVPFVALLKEKINLPIILTNDANAAAIGEKIYGSAIGNNNFIMITLGTGVGSGIVANGELIYGHDGFAGEIGHTTVYYNGRQCGCGRLGCLETYVSAPGVVRTANELLEKKSSILSDIPNFTSKDITEAALKGDDVALEVFEFSAKILGRSLANSAAHLSPESIFLFGGLANAGDLIFKPTKRYFEEHALNLIKNKIQILPSGLPEANAAVLGAASLVWDDIEK